MKFQFLLDETNKKKKFLFLFSLYIFPFVQSKNIETFFRKLIQSNALVFDVGAHLGNKTKEYLKYGARVICIEPQLQCCATLQSKFKQNSNVIIEPVGLSYTPGVLALTIGSATTLSTFSKEWQEISRHKQRGYTWNNTIMVPVTTLDHLIEKYGLPVFCKIDVENFEYEVLQGLTQPIPSISFEFHVETFINAARCTTHLAQLGYTHFNFAAGEYPEFILDQWVDAKMLMQAIKDYSSFYLAKEQDPLWGDIYATYS